jgi:hypothetical protein
MLQSPQIPCTLRNFDTPTPDTQNLLRSGHCNAVVEGHVVCAAPAPAQLRVHVGGRQLSPAGASLLEVTQSPDTTAAAAGSSSTRHEGPFR